MGLHNLVLVEPRKFPHEQASKRAAGAEDVLLGARVVESLDEALLNTTLVLGTSVREREVNWPIYTPRDAAQIAVKHSANNSANRVAILFGREHSGLTNDELDRCSAQISIPADQEYSSLNLASAVQIIAYELRLANLAYADALVEVQGTAEIQGKSINSRQQAATHHQRVGHLDHLSHVLKDLNFAHNQNSPLLMRKLTRLYNKAELTVEEVQILRGILTAIQSRSTRS